MLKKLSIILIIGVAGAWFIIARPIFLNLSTSGISTSKVFSSKVTTPKVEDTSIARADIIERTNRERVAEGFLPLATNDLLNESAEMKVDDMIKRQYFEHQSPTGEGVSDLGTKVGYAYVTMGENLALGDFTTADEIVTAWMESPGHRANILNAKYQEIGVSVKHATYQGKEVWFAVQHFGASREVCPLIDASLKKEIDAINSDLQAQQGSIALLKQSLEAPGASTSPSYQSNIAAFNQSVDEYNAKLKVSRGKIDEYNLQVKNFNRCITTFQ